MSVDEGELPDRRVHRALIDDLLHLLEDCGAFLLIELGTLLLEHLVEVGVAAIGVSPAFDRQGFEAGRRLARRAASPLCQVLVFLFPIALSKNCAFSRLPTLPASP